MPSRQKKRAAGVSANLEHTNDHVEGDVISATGWVDIVVWVFLQFKMVVEGSGQLTTAFPANE